jgi:hypothetical protein
VLGLHRATRTKHVEITENSRVEVPRVDRVGKEFIEALIKIGISDELVTNLRAYNTETDAHLRTKS